MSMTRVYGQPNRVNVTSSDAFPVREAARMTRLSVQRIVSLRDGGIIQRGGQDNRHKVIVDKWHVTIKGKPKTFHGLRLADQS
jgi:hypothetical protein